MKGKLFLVPSSIGETTARAIASTSPEVIDALTHCPIFVMETPKAGRAFIKKVTPTFNFQDKNYYQLNKYSTDEELGEMLNDLNKGNDIALLSDAGNPCIADPGNILVAKCHENSIKVVPLTGPSSILMALVSSGFNGQLFTFNGYLPKSEGEQTSAIRKLESQANHGHSQLFMETPFRNQKLLELLLKTLSSNSLLLIACNINTEEEFIACKKVSEWKKNLPNIMKKPTIFGLGQFQTQGVKSKRK